MDLTALTDTDLHDLSAQIAAEWDRRRASAFTDATVMEVITGLQDSGKLPKPDALTDPESLPEDTSDIPEWANPRTDHSAMYRQGDIVTHKQRVWVSQHPGLNHWEPGSPGVDGKTWRAKIDHVTHEGWPPSAATHAVWEPVT